MQVKLRIQRGRLQDRGGENAGSEIIVSKPRFVIGSGEDCHMRCKSSTISNHHCVLMVAENSVSVRDLGSESGTFVNDLQIDREKPLQVGDRLRVGRLEFEVHYEKPVLQVAQGDSVDSLVSDMLVEADNMEREKRLHDPNARQFQLPQPTNRPKTPESEVPAPKPYVPPKKKAPGKLPPAAGIEGKDTVDAAAKALEQLFQPKKK